MLFIQILFWTIDLLRECTFVLSMLWIINLLREYFVYATCFYSYGAFLLIENAFWRCLIIIEFQVRRFKVEVRKSTSTCGNLESKCGNLESKCGILKSKCGNSDSKCGNTSYNYWCLCFVKMNYKNNTLIVNNEFRTRMIVERYLCLK